MAKTIKVTVTPASGDPTELEASGNSVAEVLEAAGRDAKGMNVFVNGKPAKMDTHVKDGDEIKLNERPAGS
jgi:sulfur carrier protein ThiS